MTLQEIASFVNQAIRFKLTTGQITLILDAVQKLAFDENMKAFQVRTQELTAYQVLAFQSTGYTNAVAGDVGKTVVQGSFSGTLISFDNTAREWVIDTDDTFAAATAVTITAGTGAGTTLAVDHQEGYIGPYEFPTDPPVRKMLGVTTLTERQIHGVDAVFTADNDDYGLFLNDYLKSHSYQGGTVDDLAETFTFANPPAPGTTFYWVYWRGASDITGIDSGNDANLLLPSRYHFNFVRACIKAAKMTIAGGSFTRADVEEDLGPWWESLRRPYTPQGKARNLTSLAGQSGEVLV